MIRPEHWPLVAMAIAQLADVLTTIRVLRAGGREMNPVIAWMMESLGGAGWIVAKLALAAGATWLLWSAGYPQLIWIAAGLVALVALRNWRQV